METKQVVYLSNTFVMRIKSENTCERPSKRPSTWYFKGSSCHQLLPHHNCYYHISQISYITCTHMWQVVMPMSGCPYKRFPSYYIKKKKMFFFWSHLSGNFYCSVMTQSNGYHHSKDTRTLKHGKMAFNGQQPIDN